VKDFYLQDSFVSEDEVRQSLVTQREARARRVQELEALQGQLERIEEDDQGEEAEASEAGVSEHGDDGEVSENGTGRGTGYTGSVADRDELEAEIEAEVDEIEVGIDFGIEAEVENDDLPELVEDSVDSEIESLDEISIGGTSDDSWATDIGERDMESIPLLDIEDEVDEEMENMQSFDEIVANLNNRSVEELQSLMDADLEQLGPPISLREPVRNNRSIINRPLRNINPTHPTQNTTRNPTQNLLQNRRTRRRTPLVRRPFQNSRLLHAEVAIRNGYHVDITTDGEMDNSELNALTDIALMRLLNVWMGSNETQSRTSVGVVNSPSLLDHFIAGGREFIEILMSYSVDIPYAGPYILTCYLWILNAIERTLNSFRSAEVEELESEDESVCSEETIVSEDEFSVVEHIDSEIDIEIKIVFLDDRREVLKVHPDSRLKSLKPRLVTDKNVNLRYVQNGKVLDDSLSYKQLGICDENNSKVLHCIKSKKPENKKKPLKKVKKISKQTTDSNNNLQPENSGSQPQSSSINKITAQINTLKNWMRIRLPVIKQKMTIALHQTLYLFEKYRENILVGLIILWTLHMFHIYAYANSYVILTFDSNEPLSMLLNAITILSVTILHTMA